MYIVRFIVFGLSARSDSIIANCPACNQEQKTDVGSERECKRDLRQTEASLNKYLRFRRVDCRIVS